MTSMSLVIRVVRRRPRVRMKIVIGHELYCYFSKNQKKPCYCCNCLYIAYESTEDRNDVGGLVKDQDRRYQTSVEAQVSSFPISRPPFVYQIMIFAASYLDIASILFHMTRRSAGTRMKAPFIHLAGGIEEVF